MSAPEQKNKFTLVLYRLRHLLDEPATEERLRATWRLAYSAGQRAANAMLSGWRGERPTESAQVPVPLLSAPRIIDGIAGGKPWPGELGTRIATYASEQHKEAIAALATQPKKPEQAPTIPFNSLATLPPERFLLADDSRDALFADVPVVDALPDEEDEQEEETVARPDPGLYELQQRLRFKQKGA